MADLFRQRRKGEVVTKHGRQGGALKMRIKNGKIKNGKTRGEIKKSNKMAILLKSLTRGDITR